MYLLFLNLFQENHQGSFLKMKEVYILQKSPSELINSQLGDKTEYFNRK
jgi:hypothetical protein